MKKFTKFLLLMMTILLSSSFLIAQVSPVISVQNPKAKAEITQQTKDLPSQKELDLMALHGPTLVIPPPREGGSRAVGDNCADPIVVTFPAAFPYTDVNTTNNRGNDYSNTILGYYDDGPDIIYQLVVNTATGMQMTVVPVGSCDYPGIALFSSCPDANQYIAYASTGCGNVSIQVNLNPGTYYLMVDNWPSPAYIDFTLTINQWTPAPGELCSNAISYGNVNGPPINGTLVAGGNVWYSFTSPVNMLSTVSLCAGSSMDTKLEIYTACGLPYLFYNDDACGLLSQITNIPVPAGQTLYARVYGYSTSTAGPFIITITGVASPANDECTTAQYLGGPFPQSVNGTTIGALVDCPTVLNWNAVWYHINLPYSVNNVSIDFCGTNANIPTVGIVWYYDCSNCSAYNIFTTYGFNSCGDGYTNPRLIATNIPGPTTIYFPAYVGPTGLNFHMTVDVSSTGDLAGHVTNYYGLAISGATVHIEDLGLTTVSDPSGYYSFLAIAAGTHQVSCTKTGFNPNTATVFVSPNTLTIHDFIMTQPNMVINPLLIEETLNPGEYFTTSVNVLNNGTGPLGWEAVINYPETDNAGGNYVINPPGYQAEQVQPNGAASTGYGTGSETGSRDLMVCPEGSLFSIPPVSVNNGYTSTQSTGYKCSQSYSGVTGPISTVNFWGLFAGYTLPTSPGNFLIELSQPGSVPGAVVTSVVASLVGVNTGQIVVGSYQLGFFTAEIPPTDLPAGWLSVQFQSSPIFYWCNTQAGAGFPAQQNGNQLPERLAMCLAGGAGGAGNWLTMDYYEGTVPPFGGVANIPTHLDAAGTAPGDVYTANVVFTSTPFVGEITVPVTMIIMGNELVAPENLTATLVNDITGEVSLTWEWAGDAFQFFLIKRNGVIIGTTTSTNFTDLLPDFGEYCYTVQAVYDEGQTSPAGPECIEWPNPTIFINPMNLEGWVWVNNQVKVYTTISNIGIGTLHYTFPDFAASDNLSAGNTINLPAGPTSAPQNTAVASGFKARPESTYTLGADRGGREGVTVLLVAADPATNIKNLLTAYGDLGAVDYYDARNGTPSLGQLEEYNVVVTWSNYTYNSAVNLGNVLADYVDAGGRVINLMFGIDPSWGLQGRFVNENYTAMKGTGTNYSTSCLGTYDPTHPIFEGVTNVCDYYRLANPTLTSGSTWIAKWSDNSIFVAVKDDNTVVSMGGYVGDSHQWSGQMPDVLHNAINWVAGGGNFIVAVNPATANVAAGESQLVEITYDATGFDPGTYTEDLEGQSNDPAHLDFIIGNTMHVYVPAQFAGSVYDMDDNSPISGALVTAGPFQTSTSEDGTYSLYVDEGSYNVVFQKLGYIDVTVADTFALQGVVTPITVGMYDENYAPGFVHAEVMDNDTWCEVTWTLPDGPYEIIMDDGEADDYFLWSSTGNMDAVKFTPAGYPATAIGGQIYVGDGSFPGPFLGTEFGIAIFADDGPNGLPGTMLDSSGVTVNNYGWVSFDWLSATIESGSFYLAMIQTAPSINAAPIGVDLTNPTYYKSYIHMVGAPSWVLSPLQDFMMRAWVSGPESDGVTESASARVLRATPRVPANWQQYATTKSGTLPKILPGYERNDVSYKGVEGMENRNVTNYRVARYSNFDPNGSPAAGTLTELATTGNLYYNDNAFAGLPQGWYAYGVKALYTSGLYSNYSISNIVGHHMDYQVTVNVTLSTGLEPINVEVTLQGLEYPYLTLFAVTPANGTVVFDPVWRGHYDITALKIGYDTYKINNTFINSDKVFNIVLSEKKYPPTCLVVDPVSLIATWCEPLRTAIDENFENPAFPPAGWQTTTAGASAWQRTEDGSSSNFPIPTWDSFYACTNDDAAGSTNDGCCDYLITPAVDLRESLGYALIFNSYYDGAFGELAFVEYSVDGGATWELLSQLTPATTWTSLEIDLSEFSGLSGPAQIMFAFHADDAGAMASGWAVDNVKVQVPAPAATYLDFWVFLDDAFEGVTTETTWNYAPILYGTTHTASVAARYTSGLSNKDYYTFFCKYLFPPDSLTGYAPDDAAILDWTPPLEVWPPQATGIPYQEYLSENNLENIRSNDAPSSGPAPHANINVPGVNPFEGIRDLTSKAWACDALAITAVTFTLGNPGTLNYLGPGASNFISAADIVGGVYYGTIYGGTFVSMDTATGAFTTIGSTADLTGLAYDYTTSTMYGVDFGGTVYTIDLETGANTVVGNSGGVLIDCACDNDGILYAVDIGSDVFGSIDKTTAAFTTISNLPFDANYAQGMQCDHGANVVYHAAYNNSLGAGQLYSVEQSTGTYTLIGNFQGNTEVDGMAMPFSGGPIPVHLPDNLLGYNIYRDGDFVAYKPHTPPGVIAHQGYVDQGLQPGIYQYTVTGVYDLTPYGFAGETGESMEEGPAEVVVDFCYNLEFVETWSLGNFDDNNWLTDGSNWTINGQAGNPAPAAEFSWDPIQTNYESSLTSYPLCATGMTEGKIWMDFDLKLTSVQPTGEELIQAQVWNWTTQVWNTVAEYSNADGSFDWTSEHINIKAQAMDKVFKIRFHAMGVNSINIIGWFVDNIHVYRACDAATDLTSEFSYTPWGIRLDWLAPEGTNIDEWIHWDDGVYSGTAVGTGGAAEFDVAARWEPSQLVNYEGASVTQIAFVPAEPTATYRVRVWIGAGAANLVCDQPVTPITNQWNTVTLTTPVPVDITQELWVGYYINTPTGYPAGVDAGPAIDGYGDMMNFGGWKTLLQINPTLDYNWNISAHLMSVAGVSMPLGKTTQPYHNAGPLSFVTNPNPIQTNQVFAPGSDGSRELTGYNIYRSENGSAFALIDFTTEITYLDPASNLVNGTDYCYMVSAVWTSETDQCESAFSNESCPGIWTGISDPTASAGSFNLYPNPANDHVYITTSGDLKRVTVYNALGQLVMDQITTGKQYELSTAGYTIGVYMVRVETAEGVTTRTLTIQR